MQNEQVVRGVVVTGRVVAIESHYYDGMTDYCAYVWNADTLTVEYLGECGYSTKIDGPEWVVAFYKIAREIERRANEERARMIREQRAAEEEAVTVRCGKTVKVVRGRKVPKGTVARVFWMGENQWGWSAGLEMESGERVFTALRNVEVVAEAIAEKAA